METLRVHLDQDLQCAAPAGVLERLHAALERVPAVDKRCNHWILAPHSFAATDASALYQ